MLEKLLIKNFQKFDELCLEFDPHITTITGDTDAGKSTTIRSLIWILLNNLRGDFFIQHEKNKVSGSLWIDDVQITREKGKGINTYRINEESHHEAVGTGVPEDIQRIFNICQESIQQQLDPPFLFTLSPEKVSKELNSVVNLDHIDSSLYYIASEQRKTKAEIELVKNRISQYKEQKQELEWVIEANEEYKQIELLEEKINNKKEKIKKQTECVNQINNFDSTLYNKEKEVRMLEMIITLGDKTYQSKKRLEKIKNIIDDLENNQKQIQSINEKILSINNQIEEITKNKCPLCGSENEWR